MQATPESGLSLTHSQFTFPDLPELTNAKYLSAEERQLALDRLPPKKADAHNIEFFSLVKRVLLSPTM
jgi:ACS family pantothenate transporter-like MFS transporter